MNVLLLHLDGKLPNLALMRLAAWHRSHGDSVELRFAAKPSSVERHLGDHFERVYASLIFERSRPTARRLLQVYPAAIVGGTGWDLATTLESIGVPESTRPDYSDYPAFTASLGFTQRGCRLSCEFCVVPRKEPELREVAAITDLYRGPPYPKNLILLDNDFFGQEHWRERIAEMREGNFRVSFNQGVNARMLSVEAAEAIASVRYSDDGFTRPRIYTAWDSKDDETVLFRGLKRLVNAGVRPDNVMVYVLIGFWAGETESDWIYRIERLQAFGVRPYPMPYVRNGLTRGFQRWVARRAYHKISWAEYKAANCRPEKMKAARVPLPLFDGLEE